MYVAYMVICIYGDIQLRKRSRSQIWLKSMCSWNQETKRLLAEVIVNANSFTWSFPLAECTGLLALPYPLTEISSTFWAERCNFSEPFTSIREQHVFRLSRISPLSPSPPQLLIYCFMWELEGWLELAWFSKLGFEVSSDAIFLLMVACLHRWVWKWTLRQILTWQHLMELVAFHSWQAVWCPVSV